MSRKGCSPDNAACEDFFGRLKTEMYYERKWSGITPEKFMQHVDAYIRWYNERRIKLSLFTHIGNAGNEPDTGT
ncbi:integrase [Escherichia coli]|nr:integrase [Escherichia coli]